ncbi:hypothetical protein CFP56_024318, partial [Quercus suber]
ANRITPSEMRRSRTVALDSDILSKNRYSDDHDACLSYDLFDANLTPLGWNQCMKALKILPT